VRVQRIKGQDTLDEEHRYNDHTYIKDTRFLIRKDTRVLEDPVDAADAKERDAQPSDSRVPKNLRFVLPDIKAKFKVPVIKYMVMGRRGTSHDNEVNIDFAPYGAQDNGVSRLHAVIMVTEEGLKIRDVNSTNGTRLNGEKMIPLTGYILRDGDELELGKLRVQVHFDGKS